MNRMISFGYGFADGKLSVIAEEAETVKGIFSDYVNGKILKEIADDLTARQVNFFNGKCSWNKNMIFRIIENGKYIGEDGYTDKVIQYSKSGVYDVNYIVNVVSKIIIETDGTVTVEMINGTKLNDREVGNANAGKKNSNENSRESDSRKAE